MKKTLTVVLAAAAIAGIGFVAGYQSARPRDMVEVSWTKECTPQYAPEFKGCRAVIREFDRRGQVQLTFERSMDDAISTIFE